jgi:hypothetical protein
MRKERRFKKKKAEDPSIAGRRLSGGIISAVETCNETVSQYYKLHRGFPKGDSP